MRMRGSLKGLVVGLLLLSSLSWARLDEPHQVQELAYGEVAYLYLKGDYFAALTRAQMALERGEVDIHKADMEVLLGAMYSAYGMPEDAEQVFNQLLDTQVSGEVAQRWTYADGSGEIGVISSVTQAFCSTCTRARVSTDGKLYTCLFAESGHDLRALMRSGKSDTQITNAIGLIWNQREDRYSELRTAETTKHKKVEMSYIGG